jgi:hypothetical protein
MFEQLTEHARRAMYRARTEALLLHSERMETEHLLLGILLGDTRGVSELSGSAVAAIRQRIQKSVSKAESSSVASDLAWSDELKRVMVLAAAEADSLQHMLIDTPHLLLGMLRIEDCTAAQLLREQGVDFSRYRETPGARPVEEWQRSRPVERPIDRPAPWTEAPTLESTAARIRPSIQSLESLLEATAAHLHGYSDSYGDQKLKRKRWTRKEAFGHLIDWSMAHQQWFAQALMESKLTAAGYPGEAHVAIQNYADFSWRETVDLWFLLNWLLVHLLRRVPEDKLDVPCRIGIADPLSFAELVAGYVSHCEDLVGQILARL